MVFQARIQTGIHSFLSEPLIGVLEHIVRNQGIEPGLVSV